MKSMPKGKRQFYGTVTVGERGQVVIPAEARKDLGLEPGEKLLSFGIHGKMFVITKLSNVEKFAEHLSDRLASVQKIIKENRRK